VGQLREYSLEAIRTDGWFERVGQGIGSFQTLCEVLGERFFAFGLIVGAQITTLTIDRRNPDRTMVEFVVGAGGDPLELRERQQLSLPEFRRRVVSALLSEEIPAPPPERATDMEALQLHLGVRYLLLAPLFGFSFESCLVDDSGTEILCRQDGLPRRYELRALQARLRTMVREEFQRASRKTEQRNAIDLGRVIEAQEAAARGDHRRVLELLGSWPAPLAIYLRTTEGQGLNGDNRVLIARGLSLLGSSCIALGEREQGEEVLRLAIQFAEDGPAAAEAFCRLGEALAEQRRHGEAVGAFRRAHRLGAPPERSLLPLAAAFAERGRNLAALGCLLEARDGGLSVEELEPLLSQVEERVGLALGPWKETTGLLA